MVSIQVDSRDGSNNSGLDTVSGDNRVCGVFNKTAVDDPFRFCGVPHPTLRGVTCVNRGGKCMIDWHRSVSRRNQRWYVYVEWGATYEEHKRRLNGSPISI